MIPLSSPISSPLCLICVSFFLSEVFLETLHVIATFLPESLATCRVHRRFLSLAFEILQSWSSSASQPPPLVQPTRPVPSCVLCLLPCVCPAEAALHARDALAPPRGALRSVHGLPQTSLYPPCRLATWMGWPCRFPVSVGEFKWFSCCRRAGRRAGMAECLSGAGLEVQLLSLPLDPSAALSPYSCICLTISCCCLSWVHAIPALHPKTWFLKFPCF